MKGRVFRPTHEPPWRWQGPPGFYPTARPSPRRRHSQRQLAQVLLTYLNALSKLDAFLEERGMPRELRAIGREHLEAWIVDMQDRGLQPGTVSIRFRAMRPFFRWLVEEDEIERNPMDKMKSPSVPINPPAVVPEADVPRLLAAAPSVSLFG